MLNCIPSLGGSRIFENEGERGGGVGGGEGGGEGGPVMGGGEGASLSGGGSKLPSWIPL